MLRFQRVLIRGRWVQTRLLSLNASTVGGVLRYVSETCVQDRKLLFRPFKLSKSHLDGRASRPVGRVELAPRKNVFPVAYTVLWVRMPVYMCSGLRLKETRRGAALSDFCISFLFKTHTHKLKRSILNIDVEAVMLLEQSGSAVFMSDNYNLLLNEHSQPQSEISPITSPESFLQNHRRRYTTGK